MSGDYTKVSLRRDERWTGARMQQGRVLLDHDWNLNADAAARTTREAVEDAIGKAGVEAGSSAFDVAFASGGTDLTLGAGRMWVGGLAAFAPAPFTYNAQEFSEALPKSGAMLVYLDVWEEQVQPAEDASFIDPALGLIDTTARTRIGYQVHVEPTTATTRQAAWAAHTIVAQSTGKVTITAITPNPSPDPCSPYGDPSANVPDGLFRLEVIDGGTEGDSRFAWSFENGAHAVEVVSLTGSTVHLAPSNLRFDVGDLVEVSGLARRGNRKRHGPLYSVLPTPPGSSAGTLVLDRSIAADPRAAGLCVRRWDGQAVGAVADTVALWHGRDVGIRFTAGQGTYLAGDWWGAWLRAEGPTRIEERQAADPDGILHASAPLAHVDLGTKAVSDWRPKFHSLADMDYGAGACTVAVGPGDDLQAALDSLPDSGGLLCMAAGTYPLPKPLTVTGRSRIVINGAGPATILQAVGSEAAIVFDTCREIEVRNLCAEGSSPGGRIGDAGLEGALTFLSCRGVTVHDCDIVCPDQTGRVQTCITVRQRPGGETADGIRIERNRLQIGAWQTGILVCDSATTIVSDNQLRLGPATAVSAMGAHPTLAVDLAGLLRAGLRAKAGPGVVQIDPPGSNAILVQKGSEAELIARDFVKSTTAAKVARAGGTDPALLAYIRAIGQGSQAETISDQLKRVIDDLLARTRAAGQGIVVAGGLIGMARIERNLVEDAVQGIHVGVSNPRVPGRELASEVMIVGNVVHALVPEEYPRDRHAIFVGNALSIVVADTIASLRRNGFVSAGGHTTPVEGIRIHGVIGPFMSVRDSSLERFDPGVHIVPMEPIPTSRMWLVANTLALGASGAVKVEVASTVELERNYQ